MEAAQVDVDFIQVPLLEAGSGSRRRAKRSSNRKFKQKQRGGAERVHLQQQGVDAGDARLGDGRQEVVFYSEGDGKTSVSRAGRIANAAVLSPLALRNDDKRDDQHGADPESRHQDLDQELTCAGRPIRRQKTGGS